MQFEVAVIYTVSADCAVEACKKVNTKKVKRHGRAMVYNSETINCKPVDEFPFMYDLEAFFNAEIQNNDKDPNGDETTLNDIRGSLEQMPDDVVIEQCGGNDTDMSDEEFVQMFDATFNRIYSKYGGDTTAAFLLDLWRDAKCPRNK